MNEHQPAPLGRPVQPLGQVADKRSEQTPSGMQSELSAQPAGARGRDNMLGRPKQKVAEALPSAITQEQVQRHDQRKREERQQQSVQEMAGLPVASLSFGWIKGLWGLAWVLAGLMGLFVLGQVLDIIQALEGRAIWVQMLIGLAVLGFGALIIYPIWQLRRRYRELTEVKQINLVAVRRGESEMGFRRARQVLEPYSQKYLGLSAKAVAHLEKIGMDVPALETAARYLQKENERLDSTMWLDEFENRLLSLLDAAAHERIQFHAKMVALKAALSPNALLDMAMVLYNGFSLLNDLCQIYQVRASRIGMAYLMGLVVTQAYLAGEVEDNVGEALSSALPESLLGNISSVAGSAGIQAGVHFLFMRRIGKRMQRTLRPLQ